MTPKARHHATRMLGWASVFMAAMMLQAPAWAQDVAAQPAAATPPDVATSQAQQAVELDRVVAVVNSDLILESDVNEERRLELLQPFRAAVETTRDKVIERLVDRTLILQQARLQPEPPITDAAVDAEFATLRKEIPACKEYHCETDAGWIKFLADQGFTIEELRGLWRQRMEVLRFIEERFRTGVRISDNDVKTYYEKTLLPEYTRRRVTAPPLDTISSRIEEILLQQQVSALLTDWLKSLRVQGSVRMMQPGQEAP